MIQVGEGDAPAGPQATGGPEASLQGLVAVANLAVRKPLRTPEGIVLFDEMADQDSPAAKEASAILKAMGVKE